MKFEEWYTSYKSTFDKRTAELIWTSCKQECLKLLRKPIQNCDLSWEEVDARFVDKIEKEV